MSAVFIGSPRGGASGKIDRVSLQIRERTIFERRFVGGAQHDTRGLSRVKRLLPARRAQAPAIAFLQSGKAECGHRRRKIVAARLREGEKRFCHDDADRVAANIFRTRVAAAVAKKSGERRCRAWVERSPEHIARLSSEAAAF